MVRGWRGGAKVQKKVEILVERGRARTTRGGGKRGCNGVVFFSLYLS